MTAPGRFDVVADMRARALRAVATQLLSEDDGGAEWPWIAEVLAAGSPDLQTCLDVELVRLAAMAVEGWAAALGVPVGALLQAMTGPDLQER